MESPLNNLRHTEEQMDLQNVQQYCHDLMLKEEDLRKRILDIGSGSARFSRHLKNKINNNQVYNVSLGDGFNGQPFKERTRSVIARAEKLPFKDESFELVISTSALPNSYLGIEDPDELRAVLRQFITEALRVTKKKGEVRLGAVPRGLSGRMLLNLRSNFDLVLSEMKIKLHYEIEIIPTTEVVDEEGAVDEIQDLIILKKN